MTYMLMIGGPADGRLLDVSERATEVGWAVARIPGIEANYVTNTVASESLPPPHTVDYYRLKRIVTHEDGWVQTVLVHPSAVGQIDEATMIRAIMEPWRAEHRREAS